MKDYRHFEIGELRTSDEDRKISGYAAVFEKLSENLGFNVREKIKKGAFANSVSGGDVRAFWSHDTAQVLGRTRNGSLKLFEDDHGLGFELNLPDTQLGRDAFTVIKRGDVTGMSFGFEVKADQWERGKDGAPHIRTLLDVELFEVSPTAFPAYPQTNVGVRSLEDVIKKQEEVWEQELAKAKDEDPRVIKLRKLEGISKLEHKAYA